MEGAWLRRKCAGKPFGMDPPKTRTWNPRTLLRHCDSVCHWGRLQILIAINCKIAHACVLWMPPFSIWPCGLMDKALVLGTKDCRFESCQGQFVSPWRLVCCVRVGPVALCGWACVGASVCRCASVRLRAYLRRCVCTRIVCVCARVPAESTHRGARTHDHKVKSLALCRLS